MWVAADLLCLYTALMKNELSRVSNLATFEHGRICEMDLEDAQPKAADPTQTGAAGWSGKARMRLDASVKAVLDNAQVGKAPDKRGNARACWNVRRNRLRAR